MVTRTHTRVRMFSYELANCVKRIRVRRQKWGPLKVLAKRSPKCVVPPSSPSLSPPSRVKLILLCLLSPWMADSCRAEDCTSNAGEEHGSKKFRMSSECSANSPAEYKCLSSLRTVFRWRRVINKMSFQKRLCDQTRHDVSSTLMSSATPAGFFFFTRSPKRWCGLVPARSVCYGFTTIALVLLQCLFPRKVRDSRLLLLYAIVPDSVDR